MLKLIALALIPFALVAGNATAAKGGPSPGVSVGWDGTVDASSAVRYVALPSAKMTTVAAVRTSDGRVLRYATIRGAYGIPLVAFDGTAEGISSDGKTLVLADAGARQDETRFAVLSTKTLRVKNGFTLPGLWAYDAVSPNGRMLYATQYLGTGANARYNVRSVSLVTGKPVGGAIIDRREPDEDMNGSPWARTRSANGWAYTLYAKPNGTGFVHALDTAKRRAFCVDLPWRTSVERLAAVRLALAADGRSLELATRGGNRLAVVDTTTFKVTAYAKP
jgi:hypothetical protein